MWLNGEQFLTLLANLWNPVSWWNSLTVARDEITIAINFWGIFSVQALKRKVRFWGNFVTKLYVYSGPFSQLRAQTLSPLPTFDVGRKTLVASGHMTSQNLGGNKFCWAGRVTVFWLFLWRFIFFSDFSFYYRTLFTEKKKQLNVRWFTVKFEIVIRQPNGS